MSHALQKFPGQGPIPPTVSAGAVPPLRPRPPERRRRPPAHCVAALGSKAAAIVGNGLEVARLGASHHGGAGDEHLQVRRGRGSVNS